MVKIADIRIRDDRKSTLEVDFDCAALVRRVAFHEGRSKKLSSVVRDMAAFYAKVKYPKLRLPELVASKCDEPKAASKG